MKKTLLYMVFMTSFSCFSQEKHVEKPNVVYLFSDEHRYQSMQFTETPEVITPNMNRLAQEGVSFKNAISNNPVCAPHRSMLLSGQWCHKQGW